MPSHTEFIPPRLRIREWEDIEPYFTTLERSRPRTLQGLKELIGRYSDVLSVYHENDVRKDLAHARNTKDIPAKNIVEHCIEEIRPQFELRIARMDRHLVEHRAFPALRRDPYYANLAVMLRAGLEEESEACIPLRMEIARIEKRCEELIGIPEAGWDNLYTSNRGQRRDVWLTIHQERQCIRDQLDAYFSALVELRHKLSQRAGFKNYRRYEHFGPYPPHRNKAAAHSIRDAAKFHRAIEHYVVPLANSITRRHRERLGLRGKLLRPWDTDGAFWGFQAPVPGEKTLTVGKTIEEFIEHGTQVLTALHPAFGSNVRLMRKKKLFDIDERSEKLPGTYCQSFEGRRLPFIFMHVTNSTEDFATFTHECGHASHVLATRDEPLLFYREFGTDYTMAETASETMELLCSTKWDKVMPDNAQSMRRNYLEEIVRFLPWCALVDKFQQWLYEHPHHTPAERDACFTDLMGRLYPEDINWKGIEGYRKKYWQMSGHILTSPFYYIQYAFAQLAAIEMYQHYQENSERTLERYMQGLQCGASKPYPAVWREMGISLDFSPKGFDHSLKKIPALMGFVMQEIEKLDKETGHAI